MEKVSKKTIKKKQQDRQETWKKKEERRITEKQSAITKEEMKFYRLKFEGAQQNLRSMLYVTIGKEGKEIFAQKLFNLSDVRGVPPFWLNHTVDPPTAWEDWSDTINWH